MAFDLTETLAQLVAIPSVNPMGRAEAGPEFLETRLTDHLELLFRSLGLRTERQQVAPGRANLIARFDGDVPPERGGPLVLFDAHQDTVPVDRMTIEPWTPAVRDGRLYGRGACDTKGGMAAMLAVLARLAGERPRGLPTIVMTCPVDEEFAFTGATALVSSWSDRPRGLISRAPDAAIVAEPTDLDVIIAHKGVVRWRCHTHGRAAHSSQPDAGESAVYKMARIVLALEQCQREVIPDMPTHALCGPCTMNVGTIRGGASINIVPDQCTIEIEMRFPPGVTSESVRAHLIEGLSVRVGDAAPTHDPPYMQGPALSDADNGPLAERLSAAVGEVVPVAESSESVGCLLARTDTDVPRNLVRASTHPTKDFRNGNEAVAGRRCRGVPYATDAAFFCDAGVPTVVFGPGSVDQAHTEAEWISLDKLQQAAEVLYRFIRTWS